MDELMGCDTVGGFIDKHVLKFSPYKRKVLGRLATQYCLAKMIPCPRVPDPEFGWVGVYPETILWQISVAMKFIKLPPVEVAAT